jgi:hypothetical protein
MSQTDTIKQIARYTGASTDTILTAAQVRALTLWLTGTGATNNKIAYWTGTGTLNYFIGLSFNNPVLRLWTSGDMPKFSLGETGGGDSAYITKDGSGNLALYDQVTGLKTLAELAAGATNPLTKSTILVQNGVGTDSVLINATYRVPLGYSTGIVLDTIVYVGLGSTTRNLKCKIAYGTDQSAAGTLVDTTTVTSNTAVTKQYGANINQATIPAGNFYWLEFPTVTTSFKTIVVYGLGHKQ